MLQSISTALNLNTAAPIDDPDTATVTFAGLTAPNTTFVQSVEYAGGSDYVRTTTFSAGGGSAVVAGLVGTPISGVSSVTFLGSAEPSFDGSQDTSTSGLTVLSGIDVVNTNGNWSWTFGSGFANTITGSNGEDYLYSGGGDDRLNGLEGSDTLVGGAGNDTMTGGGDAYDLFVIDQGVDVVTDLGLHGGSNDDFYVFAGATALMTQDTDTYEAGTTCFNYGTLTITVKDGLASTSTDLQLMVGDRGATIVGNSSDNTVDGSVFNDTITGGAGVDDLDGNGGADRFIQTTGAASTGFDNTATGKFTFGGGVDIISGFTSAESDVLVGGTALTLAAIQTTDELAAGTYLFRGTWDGTADFTINTTGTDILYATVTSTGSQILGANSNAVVLDGGFAGFAVATNFAV